MKKYTIIFTLMCSTILNAQSKKYIMRNTWDCNHYSSKCEMFTLLSLEKNNKFKLKAFLWVDKKETCDEFQGNWQIKIDTLYLKVDNGKILKYQIKSDKLFAFEDKIFDNSVPGASSSSNEKVGYGNRGLWKLETFWDNNWPAYLKKEYLELLKKSCR